jgi:hypothetical protein
MIFLTTFSNMSTFEIVVGNSVAVGDSALKLKLELAGGNS